MNEYTALNIGGGILVFFGILGSLVAVVADRIYPEKNKYNNLTPMNIASPGITCALIGSVVLALPVILSASKNTKDEIKVPVLSVSPKLSVSPNSSRSQHSQGSASQPAMVPTIFIPTDPDGELSVEETKFLVSLGKIRNGRSISVYIYGFNPDEKRQGKCARSRVLSLLATGDHATGEINTSTGYWGAAVPVGCGVVIENP